MTRERLSPYLFVLPALALFLVFRFYPLVSGREGGSGLGRTIAQTFIAQHGGPIECDSAPGRTRFMILVPLAACSRADA